MIIAHAHFERQHLSLLKQKNRKRIGQTCKRAATTVSILAELFISVLCYLISVVEEKEISARLYCFKKEFFFISFIYPTTQVTKAASDVRDPSPDWRGAEEAATTTTSTVSFNNINRM